MRKIIYILIFVILITLPGLSKSKKLFVITGNVVDISDNKPVVGASARLIGTAIGGISDKKGNFLIKNVTRGTYVLLITYVGYESKKVRIDLTKENIRDTIFLKIELKESSFKTDEIVISANKKVQAVQDVPISLSLIDAKDILQRNIVQFDEALKYVPGIQLMNQNISIRGSSGFAFGLGSRVTMLVNGFPMLSGDNGDIKFDIIPATEIQRIEILKGAGSALYGTGAIGGVVNIIPREPTKKPSIFLKAYSGIFTLPVYKQWQYRETLPFRSGTILSYSQSFGNFGGLVSGQYYRDEGFYDYGDETRYNFFGNFGYKINDGITISVLTNYASDNSTDWVYWNSLDSATRPPTSTDKNIRINSNKFMLATQGKFISSSKFFSTVKLSYYRTAFANTYPENNIDYRQSVANAWYAESQFVNNLSARTNLTYGLTFNWNTVQSATYGKHQQYITALYTQAELSQINNLITTVGLRFDNEKTIGSGANYVLSPKIGFNYALTGQTHLRLSAGKGFRAPTIAEKFASLQFRGFEVVPNLDLKPETSWSAELGTNSDMDFKSFALNIDGAIFYNNMNNLIEATFDNTLPNNPIKFQNITKAEIYGLELILKTIFFHLISFNTSVTLMNPVDLSLNETLKYRSKILWYNNISIPFKYFELQADYRYISKVVNVDEALALQMKDYDARVPINIVDLRILFNSNNLAGLPIKIGINAKNLLNYYYTEIPGNLGATREISLQFEGRF